MEVFMEVIVSFFLIAGGFIPTVLACLVKKKPVKALFTVLGLPGVFVNCILFCIFVLPDSLGAHNIWLSFVIYGAVFAALMLLAWKPFQPKTRRIAVCCLISAPVLLTAVFAGPEIYRRSIPQAPGEEINLFYYMPFDQDTLIKTLDQESALKLSDNLPRLDGATALYPVYSAFVRAVYPRGGYHPYYDLRGDGSDYETIAACSRTSGAFENLIDGYADVIFLMGVSDEQRFKAESRGLDLTLTPIGREAFVFFVNKRNSITNLSVGDIQRIYTGEVTNWREVSGKNDAIRAYQRPDESGSQTMLKQIMGATPIAPAPQEDTYDMMMGMYQRVAGYRNYRNSLGYSFLYYIRDMINEDKIKFLSVDGVSPTPENIDSGAYPFANDFYAITVKRGGEYLNAERAENIDSLLAWITSPQGQYLVEATGYIPVD